MTNPLILSDTEIEQINEAMVASPEGYFYDWSVKPSASSIDKLMRQLKSDFGSELVNKAINIPHVNLLGIRGLFDGLYQQIINADFNTVDAGNLYSRSEELERGPIDYIQFGDQVVLVKFLQGRLEGHIARKAYDIGIGPKTYGPVLPIDGKTFGIVEDYIGMTRVYQGSNEVTIRGMNDSNAHSVITNPFELGQEFGRMLKKLHDSNIIYSDGFFRHLEYSNSTGFKLIDYGVSFFCNDEEPIDENYAWRLSLHRDEPKDMYWNVFNDPKRLKEYCTADPIELKVKEFEFFRKDLVTEFYKNFASWINLPYKESSEKLGEGIDKGYSKLD